MKYLTQKLSCKIDNIENFNLELHKINYHCNINKYEIYEYYMVNKCEKYIKFLENIKKNEMDYKTPYEKICQIKYFSDEIYLIYLKQMEKNMGCNNIENVVIEFYYLIQDIYYGGKIYLNMKFDEILYAIKDHELFLILKRSKYNPIDIYYYFMKQLENRLKYVNLNSNTVSEIDKNAIEKYYNYIEETKEEGEI